MKSKIQTFALGAACVAVLLGLLYPAYLESVKKNAPSFETVARADESPTTFALPEMPTVSAVDTAPASAQPADARSFLAVAVDNGEFGNLVGASEYQPYEPIVVGCDCIIPKDADVKILWKSDSASNLLALDSGTKAHLWAPPGEHWAEATVTINEYETLQVFKPDPAAPQDVTKAKLVSIRVLKSFSQDRYEKRFVVKGATPVVPTPKPDDKPVVPVNPDVPTPPTDEFAKKIHDLIYGPSGLVAAKTYDKALMLKVADVYLSIASQANAGGGNSWTRETFVALSKDKNYEALGVTKVEQWREVFFRPLAEHQAALAAQRKLSSSDVKGLAQLWNETGEAIKAAAK